MHVDLTSVFYSNSIFDSGNLDMLDPVKVVNNNIVNFHAKKNYQKLKRLTKPITPQEITKISSIWSPYRSVASWYLWQGV